MQHDDPVVVQDSVRIFRWDYAAQHCSYSMGNITIEFAEGTVTMGTGKTLVGSLKLQVARALAARAATPLILSGTLACAGLGAAALTPARISQTSPSPVSQATLLEIGAPHTFCYVDYAGDGHTICHVLASRKDAVPNLGCMVDPDGDGTYICDYATDPTIGQ